jgi:hypothetical protein
MKCPRCGSEEHPSMAIVCVRCGFTLDPSRVRPIEESGPKFPCLFDVRCWLEANTSWKALLGSDLRGFGICFSVMPAPKREVAVDGSLRIRINSDYRIVDFEQEVRVRSEDFVKRSFELLSLSYRSLSWLHRHAKPEIPVPVPGRPYKLELYLETDAGEIYEAAKETCFNDREPAPC